MRTPVSVGVVGLGYWGPNLARTFDDLPQANLRWLCDTNAEIRLKLRPRYPNAEVTADFDELLADDDARRRRDRDAVPTHGAFAQRALDADKHSSSRSR